MDKAKQYKRNISIILLKAIDELEPHNIIKHEYELAEELLNQLEVYNSEFKADCDLSDIQLINAHTLIILHGSESIRAYFKLISVESLLPDATHYTPYNTLAKILDK